VGYDFRLFTGKQRKFAEEYVLDLNMTAAARRAGYADPSSAACTTIVLEHVQSYINHLVEKRAKRLEPTQDEVVARLWAIATTDVNEVVQYRRTACRYCYGTNYRYQWTDAEYERACEEAAKRSWPQPVQSGGVGYSRDRDPNPACPECKGEGKGEIHAQDTRKMGEGAKMLYAGVKAGRDGLEMKTHDQVKVLELLGRHLGMFKDKVEHSGEIASNGPTLNVTLAGATATPQQVVQDPQGA